MIAAQIAALVMMAGIGHAELPREPFQRVARRALTGEFGQLAPWQREGYARGLERGVRADRTCFLTSYYGTEGRSGRTDCKGRRCTLRTAAANTIPQGAYIWTEHGIRQVRDTGSRGNDSRARRHGADHWVDYWYPRVRDCPFGGTAVVRMAVIG
jgi:hypothetical protein